MGLVLKFKQLVSGETLDFVGQAANQANAMVLLGKTLADAAHQVSDHADEQVEFTSDVAASIEQEEMRNEREEIRMEQEELGILCPWTTPPTIC